MLSSLPVHNLPPRDYAHFVGRQSELAEVSRLLLPRSRAFVITIDGIGGIGKSALALELAHRFVETYSTLLPGERYDAIVWVSAKRSFLTTEGILERRQVFRTLDDLFVALADVLDFPAITRARADDQRAIVEQVLTEQRTLLILDNLETVDDEELLAFLRELPAPTKAIVTTRHRIDVAHPVRLTGLPHAEALALIAQEGLRKHVQLTTAEQEDLRQRTGGVPLAVVWSIGLMGLGGSVASVLRRLSSGQSDIARFCFAESIAQIRERDAYWLLLALALFAADASREALGVVAGLADDTFGRDLGLEELVRLSLVNKEGDRFSVLPLTRSYVQSEASQHAEFLSTARTRLYAYFDVLTRERGGWSKDWEGQELIERELPNLLAIIDGLFAELRYCEPPQQHQLEPASVPLAQLLCKLLPRIVRTCRLRGHWSLGETLNLRALAIAQYDDHPAYIGYRYWDRSRISLLRGNLDEAEQYLRRTIVELQKVNNQNTLARAQAMLGIVLLQRGDQQAAEQFIAQGLAAYDASGKSRALADVLEHAGQFAHHRAEYAAAVDWYRQALDAAQATDDLPRIAAYQLSLGKTLVAQGKPNEALTAFQQSQQAAQQCGRLDTQALAALQIAILSTAPDQRPAAHEQALRARDLFRRLGMHQELAESEGLWVEG